MTLTISHKLTLAWALADVKFTILLAQPNAFTIRLTDC
jgi:hypothetical protein